MAIRTFLHSGTSFIELLNLEKLEIIQQVNEHAVLELVAVLKEESEIKYARNVNAFETIEIYVEDKERKTVFVGFMKSIRIKQIEKSNYLYIQGVSATYKTDLKIKSRSFQDINITYKSMIQEILYSDEDYIGADLYDNITNNASIGKFIMQYKETDWQFIKRMASHFNAVIIPDVLFPSPKIKIGVPEGKERGKVEKYNFYVTKNLERFMVSSKNESNKITELDTVSIHIETTDDFEIGDTLTYQYDKESNMIPSLFIKKKYTRLSEGALRFEYELSTDKGISQDKFYNEKITGLSLQGKVLSRIQDTVRVLLEIDDEQDVSKAWDFPYTTPYTAEGSGGWYVMPEIGDTVYIYFPNREEHFGVGLNSIRLKNKGTDKIGNPNVKYLRTKDGKEIKLAPDELTITCSNWKNEKTGEENIIYIRLNQDRGITIQSTKPINFNSDGDINFTADKNIKFEALEEIKLKCQSSQIIMGSSISIDSPDVKIN